jgi:hypothetical protein
LCLEMSAREPSLIGSVGGQRLATQLNGNKWSR